MKMFSAKLGLALALMSVASVGCGSGEPTVIQPGPDYQLTPDEVRMKAEMDAVPPPSEQGYSPG